MASDVQVAAGRREMWLDFGPLYGAGWVCGEPMPNMPDEVCGMPTESEPCATHHPRQED